MVFKCQEDSFLKQFESKVLSCEKANIASVVNGSKTKIDGYDVILEDTILFPEGGGQPCDYGFLNDVSVKHVVRRGIEAVHFVTEPFKVGDNVKQVVDWDRRLDHMQQHSGQHLITAIIDREYGFNTSSWWLGEETSHVELDTPSISEEQIRKAESICNALIQASTPVTVAVIKEESTEGPIITDENKENEHGIIIHGARTRGLPDDYKGDIRVITIHGVESNMCCGTHVSNLSQLQTIKILYAEKGKRKDKTILYFLVGNRVLKQLNNCLEREQKLTGLLKNNPSQHAELVEKLQKNLKAANKNLQTALKDVAIFEVEKLRRCNPKPKYYSLHRKEAEADFMNIFVKEYGSSDIFLFLTVGDEKAAGNMLIYGPEIPVASLGAQISTLLNGKGAGKGNRYQAKVSNMSQREKCIQLIVQYFESNPQIM